MIRLPDATEYHQALAVARHAEGPFHVHQDDKDVAPSMMGPPGEAWTCEPPSEAYIPTVEYLAGLLAGPPARREMAERRLRALANLLGGHVGTLERTAEWMGSAGRAFGFVPDGEFQEVDEGAEDTEAIEAPSIVGLERDVAARDARRTAMKMAQSLIVDDAARAMAEAYTERPVRSVVALGEDIGEAWMRAAKRALQVVAGIIAQGHPLTRTVEMLAGEISRAVPDRFPTGRSGNQDEALRRAAQALLDMVLIKAPAARPTPVEVAGGGSPADGVCALLPGHGGDHELIREADAPRPPLCGWRRPMTSAEAQRIGLRKAGLHVIRNAAGEYLELGKKLRDLAFRWTSPPAGRVWTDRTETALQFKSYGEGLSFFAIEFGDQAPDGCQVVPVPGVDGRERETATTGTAPRDCPGFAIRKADGLFLQQGRWPSDATNARRWIDDPALALRWSTFAEAAEAFRHEFAPGHEGPPDDRPDICMVGRSSDGHAQHCPAAGARRPPYARSANPADGTIFDGKAPRTGRILSKEELGTAIGEASMCWENPAGAGVFNSSRASQLVERLLALQGTAWRPAQLEDAIDRLHIQGVRISTLGGTDPNGRPVMVELPRLPDNAPVGDGQGWAILGEHHQLQTRLEKLAEPGEKRARGWPVAVLDRLIAELKTRRRAEDYRRRWLGDLPGPKVLRRLADAARLYMGAGATDATGDLVAALVAAIEEADGCLSRLGHLTAPLASPSAAKAASCPERCGPCDQPDPAGREPVSMCHLTPGHAGAHFCAGCVELGRPEMDQERARRVVARRSSLPVVWAIRSETWRYLRAIGPSGRPREWGSLDEAMIFDRRANATAVLWRMGPDSGAWVVSIDGQTGRIETDPEPKDPGRPFETFESKTTAVTPPPGAEPISMEPAAADTRGHGFATLAELQKTLAESRRRTFYAIQWSRPDLTDIAILLQHDGAGRTWGGLTGAHLFKTAELARAHVDGPEVDTLRKQGVVLQVVAIDPTGFITPVSGKICEPPGSVSDRTEAPGGYRRWEPTIEEVEADPIWLGGLVRLLRPYVKREEPTIVDTLERVLYEVAKLPVLEKALAVRPALLRCTTCGAMALVYSEANWCQEHPYRPMIQHRLPDGKMCPGFWDAMEKQTITEDGKRWRGLEPAPAAVRKRAAAPRRRRSK